MMTFGLALPHFDGLFPSPSLTGAARTRAALDYACRAESLGFSTVWVSDHLWMELGDGTRRYSPDCWTLLSAIAATTETIRLGSLVNAAPLREPAVLAHQVATVTDLAPYRVDVGLGAGWHRAEFVASGVRFPPSPERIDAITRAAQAVRTRLGADTPPIWIGGKRRGALSVAARTGDGWNVAWDPTPGKYAQYRQTVDSAAAANRGNRARLACSIGLTTFVGVDEGDLRSQWARLQRWSPGGHLESVSFEVWRRRGLIGTPGEVRRRIQLWESLGVSHVICAFGIPFGVWNDEQLELFASALYS